MLRAGTFIDLYAVVRESIRAGVESYSIKDMEQYYSFARDIDLRKAGVSGRRLKSRWSRATSARLRLTVRAAVEGYNRDDVRSTMELQTWLEAPARERLRGGEDVPAAASPPRARRLRRSASVSSV